MINSNNINKKGSAIITAVGMGTVLLIIIASLFSFSKYRTQTVILESKKVKALALAEAGLDIALAELSNDSTFATHDVDINPNDKTLDWKDDEKEWENKLEEISSNKYHNSDHNFKIDSDSGKGTLSGQLGDGEFKVKIGTIPYDDNPNTPAINEARAYVKIESLGMYDNVVRKVIAVVNRRYPTREFLMYDGGVLSLIYGQTGNRDPNGVNVFSTGHLYGDKGIEIGRITMTDHNSAIPGTTQKLDNINAILSGKGWIYFEANFKSKNGVEKSLTIQPNATFPTGSSGYKNTEAEEYGEFPDSMKDTIPNIPEELKPWIKDRDDGGANIDPESMAKDFKDYKTEAQKGGFNCSSYETKYYIHKGWKDGVSKGAADSLDVVYLDFGNSIHESKVTNFPSNGYIYSDKDIVVKGNPPKDVRIVSEKNVFIAGDFNQAGHIENGPEERYGFPQKYKSGESALNSANYSDESIELFRQDKDLPDEKKHHVAATIIAKERIVYDHRSPVDCFENELYPFLKYELAKAISETENETEAMKVFDPSESQSLIINSSSSSDNFKASIATFTNTFKIADSESLANDLESVYNQYSDEGKFNDEALEQLTKKTWEAYVKDFENSGIKGQPRTTDVNEQGVYKLLFNLREKLSGNPMGSKDVKKEATGYLCYPEMTSNGMFVSYGEQANTCYAGPTVTKYYDEIGYSSLTNSYIGPWSTSTAGFLHRTFGSETYLRLNKDIVKHPYLTGNNYYPPTRRKIYDDTLPFLDNYGDDPLELTGFIVLSWQDLGSTPEEFEAF